MEQIISLLEKILSEQKRTNAILSDISKKSTVSKTMDKKKQAEIMSMISSVNPQAATMFSKIMGMQNGK